MSTCPHYARVLALLDDDVANVELEEHVAGCPACQTALARAAGPLPSPPPAPPGEDPPTALLDRLRQASPRGKRSPPVIPGLEILEEIGRGGSAVVYKARQLALDRVVALKVLTPEHARHPDGVARARRGVAALAAQEHPGIVRIFHAGEHQGVYYAIHEYAGVSLASVLDGRPWEPTRAARLVMHLADAIQAMHDTGYLHRDLKPANVLLSEGERGALAPRGEAQRVEAPPSGGSHPPLANVVPKIADFGLVRAVDDDDELTASGLAVGTPGAMAPEQAEGKRDVGPAIDLWGLGVIFYQLLTGQAPFGEGDTTEMLRRASRAAPPAPRSLARRVPKALEYICLGCLRKDPCERYPSAAALRDDLAAFLAGERLPSRPAPLLWPLLRWLRRHWKDLLIAGLLVALLALWGTQLAGD